MSPYPNSRGLAIVAGLAATGGALAILLADPISTGAWRLDHGLLPVVVGVTIAAGHLIGSALRSRKLLSAAGFALVFAVGTLLTVYSSVGGQAEKSGNKSADIEAHNKTIADKRSELVTARQRLSTAETMVERETANKRCGQACNDWKQRASEVRSHVALIEATLAALGGERVARPKAAALVRRGDIRRR